VEASGTTLTEIFGVGPILAAKIIGTVGSVARFPTKAHFASYSGTAPVEASSGEVMRHRLSLAGNRHLKATPCTWWRYARPDRTLGAAPTTAKSSRRASPAGRRCGASRDASLMPFSQALWQIRRCSHAAPLDKEEPRTPLWRRSRNSILSTGCFGSSRATVGHESAASIVPDGLSLGELCQRTGYTCNCRNRRSWKCARSILRIMRLFAPCLIASSRARPTSPPPLLAMDLQGENP
jgi:hypothetical protein